MSKVFENEKVQERIVEFLIDKGGPVSGVALCLASLSWIVLGIIRKSPEAIALGFTFFWLAVAATSIFWSSKRNRQITTVVAAEQLAADPNRPLNATSVPEVQKAIAQIAQPREIRITAPKKKPKRKKAR